MSVADLHDLELVWPSLDPTDVIVTGTFDQWSASVHLVKGDTGFSGTVKVPWGQKIAYKFIVDDLWRCRDDQPQEDDGHGNTNNVFQTPEKLLLPARLTIPLDNEGYGDLEAMVTAVEFLPSAEPTTIRGSLPLPVPQITVEGLGEAPPAGSPVSESKLNTAGATEGHVSPSETPAKAPSSSNVSTLLGNGNGPLSLPLIDGSGEAHESHSMHVLNEAATSEVAASLPTTQDTPALADSADVPPASAPPVIPQPTLEEPKVETAAEGQRQQTTSLAVVSEASTPVSSTLNQKKRRSLFARIRHMFDKDKNKQGKKEKNKH